MKMKKRYIALICVLVAVAVLLLYIFCIGFDAERIYNQIDQTKFAEKYPDYTLDYVSAADAFYLGRAEIIEIRKNPTEGNSTGYVFISYGHNYVTSDITYDISVDLRAKNVGEQVARGEKTGHEDCYFAKFAKADKQLLGEWGDWRPPDMTREEFNTQLLEMMDYALSEKK